MGEDGIEATTFPTNLAPLPSEIILLLCFTSLLSASTAGAHIPLLETSSGVDQAQSLKGHTNAQATLPGPLALTAAPTRGRGVFGAASEGPAREGLWEM